MDDRYKEVYYNEYCKTCKHEKDDESDVNSPCYDCLAQPVNLYSHKPAYWTSKEAEK